MDKIYSSILSAYVETLVTYPIDYIKTIRQVNHKQKIRLSHIYNGILYRFVGILPMRMTFWNTMYYCNANNFSTLTSSFVTSFNQTLIDYPLEQIKTQIMVANKRNVLEFFQKTNFIKGYNVTLVRNFGFVYIFNSVKDNKLSNNEFINNGVGGLMGAFFTQPFDTLKTYYQSNTPFQYSKINYMSGIHYRCSISMLSMSIGYYIYHNF